MIKTIDECFFQIQNGANIKQNDSQEGFPITRIETTANNKFNRNRMGYAGITDISKYESYVLEDEDLLMSHINSAQYLGRTVLYIKRPNETIIHGMNLLRLKANKRIINPAYARYYFYGNIFKKQIKNITKKSVNQASFSIKDLKRIQINVPNLEKQVIIVKILDKLQWIIERRKEQLNYLNDLIKARFVEMFGDENNSLNWDIVNVEEVADVQVGVVIKPSQYYTEKENGTPAFRSLNIGEGYIKDNDWVYFTQEGHDKNSKSILKENDLLIVRSGAPGTACVVSKEFEGYNAIDIIIAHPDCSKVNPYYLCTYINMPHGKKQIQEGTGGAAQQHFNVGKYNQLKLMLPPMEKQNEFVDFVKQVDKSKVVVQKALDEAQTLFDSLMQEYFG